MPDTEMTPFLLGPSIHNEMPLSSGILGDSWPVVESESAVQVSTPLVRIGTVEALLELLFPI